VVKIQVGAGKFSISFTLTGPTFRIIRFRMFRFSNTSFNNSSFPVPFALCKFFKQLPFVCNVFLLRITCRRNFKYQHYSGTNT
jgi:hypothetical protein